jgi:hypothetical protein
VNRGVALACAALLAFVARARSQTLEPPPEAGDGDYTLEQADSLDDAEFEVAIGAASRSGSDFRRSQRVSFRGGGARGTLRDGDEALSGGRVEAPLAGGTLAAGRLAPRWGRGLALGGAGEPWVFTAEDRGGDARYRGRAGTGLGFDTRVASVFAGRFNKANVAGAHTHAGAAGLGLLAGHRSAQGSLAFDGEERSLELAFDPRGRWRAEAALADAIGDTRVALRVRGGLAAFRSLAEPARAGPAHALAASATRELGPATASAFGALWAWRAGQSGARAALEVDSRLGQHGSFACGAEDQHGPRREPSPRARLSGTRQGWWCEWRGGSPGARLALRHELWGTRALARDAVRRAVVARADWAAPFGGRLALTHAVWRARSGESLYLPEAWSDRLVLRASSGAGSRTRCELRLPIATGTIRLGLSLATGGTRAANRRPAWSIEWSRRSRLAPAAAPSRESAHALRGADGTDQQLRVVRHAGAREGAGGGGAEHHPPGDR